MTHHDLSYARGANDLCSIEWQDPSGTAINLAGYSATMTIRRTDGTLLASTGSGITATITAATGVIIFTISDAVGLAMPAGVHRYDVWAISGSGIDYALAQGNFTVVPEVRNV